MPPDAPIGDRFAEVLAFCRRFLLSVANAQLPDNLRPKGGASDLVQNTLAAAHRAQHQFTGRTVAELRAWLRGILANELATFRRKYLGTASRDVTREVPVDAAAAYAAEPPLVVGLIREDDSRHLSALLARLPEESRRVVVLRLEDGLSFAAIGERTGRSEDAARKMFTRAISLLREMGARPGE